jgi:hypothetical protein
VDTIGCELSTAFETNTFRYPLNRQSNPGGLRCKLFDGFVLGCNSFSLNSLRYLCLSQSESRRRVFVSHHVQPPLGFSMAAIVIHTS